jgi:hypothetical protein
MKTLLIAIAALLYIGTNLNAKAPDTLWTKHYGGSLDDKAYNICLMHDGGFLSCCQSNSFTSNFKTWLVRMDAKGDTIWTKILGDTALPEQVISMEETKDGGFIVCGSRMLPDYKMHPYIFKLDSNGSFQWGKIISKSKNVTSGQSALQTPDNGYIVAVWLSGMGMGLYKTDEFGNVTDSAHYDWEYYDKAESIALTDDGGYVIAGSTNSFSITTEFDHIFLLKLNANLDSLWMNVYNDKDSLDERLGHVIQASDGGFLLIGAKAQKPEVQNQHDVLIIKTDKEGKQDWQKLYGSPQHEVGLHCEELSGGDFIVCGTGSSKYSMGFDAYVLRINSIGDTLWTRYYGSPGIDQIECIKPIKSGGYIIGGYSYYYSADPNKTDIYYIRLADDNTNIENISDVMNYQLIKNYPNPFSESTVISYQLSEAGKVKIEIYNSIGEKITTLVDEFQDAESHNAVFEAGKLPQGMYYYRMQIGERIENGKLMLVK